MIPLCYTINREPPTTRVGLHSGSHEIDRPEAGIMLAYAMHLVEQGATRVELRPDGEHAKRFDIPLWFGDRYQFVRDTNSRTLYAGEYSCSSHRMIIKVQPGSEM